MRNRIGGMLLGLSLVTATALGAEPITSEMIPEQIIGQWRRFITREKPDDTLVVVTFRKNGICRYDAIDRGTGKMPVGTDVHLPGVGLWSVQGSSLMIAWEQWDEQSQVPISDKIEWLISDLSNSGFTETLILSGRSRDAVAPMQWTRFEGWGVWGAVFNLENASRIPEH